MNVVNQIIAALRDGAAKTGDTAVDTHSLHDLDLAIRDAEIELGRTRESLRTITARQQRAEEKTARLRGAIAEQEGYARQALEQQDEPLAHEVAVRIARLEIELAGEREAGNGFASSVAELQTAQRGAADDLRHMKQQVDVLRASDAVDRAQQSVSEREGSERPGLRTAIDSLERIKQRQAQRASSSHAAREMAKDVVGRQALDTHSLDARLEAAGIKPAAVTPETVLERLKRD